MTGRIGYLGPKGTFTKMAVDALFNGEDKQSFKTIPECMDAIVNSQIDIGVVPLENAIEGSVNMTVDYLIQDHSLKIVGEVVVPIRQHLMVHPSNEAKWSELTTIHSHPHAVAQCHHFLQKDLQDVRIEYTTSTGAGAEFVSQYPDENIGAIGNELAAKEYGLSIVREDIHDFTNNHTRFVVLHRNSQELQWENLAVDGHKTSLIITLPTDQAGTLHQVLSAFAWRKLNLSKIESRPMKTGLGNYYFLIDIQQKLDDVLIPGAIAEIETLGCNVELLGSYPYFLVDGISVSSSNS
ncbi:prephenate dehydratase [Radiobacillus kanasensis]|uniref:prephenate dehydratase n=1 Tax=Radiobacillus kanasensis TaxID=2844358 RepID=UPI001E33C660|nr:prephenate dehydratase [Radiobacillus kanasensis]UFT97908.1 prephenate dehydratase [Radiobacillus kanasensis]